MSIQSAKKRSAAIAGPCAEAHSLDGHAIDLLLHACVQSCCSVCGVGVSEHALSALGGRPMVVSVAQPEKPRLYMCSHCAYHNIQSVWRYGGTRFNKLGAPLNMESARSFARQMGDLHECEFIVIVVPANLVV